MEIISHFHNFHFMNESKCPVPKEQQPTNEFIELSKSDIFSWPKSKKSLILVLLKFWLGAFVLFLVISSGSIYFKTFLLKYILLSFFSSLSIPLLISIRLYLGWNHVFKRLNSEKVEYEESGWYDGQVWIKPLVLKEKESLISGPLFVMINSLIRLSCHDPRILKTFKARAISPFISTY